jgi:uncharacterized Tic20 family protein
MADSLQESNQMDETTRRSQDDRVMAALAHAGVILPLWGLIGAIVIWATQREKSHLIAFQALQGAAYQFAILICGFVCFGCYMCSVGSTFLAPILIVPFAALASEGGSELAEGAGILGMLLGGGAGLLPFCLLGILGLAMLALIAYGLYGAVRVLQGHDFRYAIIGRWLERYLAQQEDVE